MSSEGSAPTAEDKARYESIKDDLKKALDKKRRTDANLAKLEFQIHNLEGSYLVDTATHSGGNIITGFDGYLKNTVGGRRKYEVSEADRMFSSSSVTYKKSIELVTEDEESTATVEDHSRMSTPGLTTVIVPPAKSQELSAAQQKKNRDREYQRKKRANAARRSAGLLSDEESVTSATSRRPSKRARLDDD